jgi:hypothetical protein
MYQGAIRLNRKSREIRERSRRCNRGRNPQKATAACSNAVGRRGK